MSACCDAKIVGCQPCPFTLPEISGFKVLSWEASSNHEEETLQDAVGNTISVCFFDPGEDVSTELVCVGGSLGSLPCPGDIISVSNANFPDYYVVSISTAPAGVKGLSINLELRHKCAVSNSASSQGVTPSC